MYTYNLAVSNRQQRRSVCIAIDRVYSLIARRLLCLHLLEGDAETPSYVIRRVGVSRRLPRACSSAAADAHAAAAAAVDADDEAGRLVCANDAH